MSTYLRPVSPPGPPLPRFTATASTISGTCDRHQFVGEAECLEQELNYLVEPLYSQAKDHSKTIFTLVHSLKPVIQKGPMCGLVAISIASQLVLEGQITPPDDLLVRARERGFSKQGEIFSARNLLELAQSELQCKGAILNGNTTDVSDLLLDITKKVAILVPYDADKDHSPCLARGHKAHWCTVVGFAIIADSLSSLQNIHERLTPANARHLLCHNWRNVDKCQVHLFCRHGKSRHMGLWSYTSLMESNANLVEVGENRDSSDYVIPSQGISNSLCSLLITLEPEM